MLQALHVFPGQAEVPLAGCSPVVISSLNGFLHADPRTHTRDQVHRACANTKPCWSYLRNYLRHNEQVIRPGGIGAQFLKNELSGNAQPCSIGA
jgi:hypothetical protein